MFRLMLALVVFSLSLNGMAEQDKNPIRFFFEGKIFLVPAGFVSSGYSSAKPATIYFGYGEVKKPSAHEQVRTWKYLAFSDGIINDKEEAGCDSADLLKSVFEPDTDTQCNPEIVGALASTLLEGSDTGFWRGKDGLTIYYSIGEKYSSLLLTDKNRHVTKIDTSFLAPETLKAVVGDLL